MSKSDRSPPPSEESVIDTVVEGHPGRGSGVAGGSVAGSGGVVISELSPPPPPPSRIGPYRIVRELGSGGMGTVFLAEQTEPVERTVALKVMRSHYLDQESRIRFETERQAMARLQHPNVAQIFEAGATEEGHPYFVMEHVDGEEVTKYCDRRRLSVEERLALFRDICAGVHHAHQKGIIHRDLKPSNVLVAENGDRPVAKIIDFGIAKTFGHKAASESQVTGNRLVGTPAYLPPEAVRLGEEPLDLDTRADVYALGILLYELLISRRPFDDGTSGLYQLLQKIAVEEPTGLSSKWRGLGEEDRRAIARQRRLDAASLRGRLRGDLDWIVLKAIAKDRQQRYDSAAALAADLERHLQHEPVEASPPSTLYRARKFVRRRAGTVLAAVAVVVALGAGLVARTLEAERANREAKAAIEARLATEVALEEAERARAEAAEVSTFLSGLFRVSDPGEGRGATITARELLDDAAVKVREGFEDQPVARARFMGQISEIYRKLGLFDRSLELAEEALSLRRRHLPGQHLDVAESLSGIAALYANLGRFEEAEPLLQEALEIRQALLDPDHLKIATSLNDLANLYTELGRVAEAEPLYRRSIAIGSRHEGPARADQLVALNNLAAFYNDAGRHDEAEPLLRQFLEQLEAEHGRRHPYVAFALENLAEVRWRLGAVEESERLFFEAEEILVEVLGPEHPEVAYCWSSLADVYSDLGRFEEAEALYRRALAIQEAKLPAGHPELESTRQGLAALR